MFFDICPTCYIAWFDSAEWDALPEQPAQQKERELSPQAREAIALAEVTRIKERDKSAAALPEEPWQWIPAILGLPVELNGPSLRCWPWVTWSLVVLCCAVYAVTFNDVPRFAEGLGFIPEAPFRYGGTTLLTSFFLHVNLLHLIGNMYFLLVFGDNVEDYLGRVRYLAMLMGGNVVGALFHGIGDLRSDVPCIGASAGISAVILFYALQFPNVQLGLFFGFGFWFQWIRFPAYLGAAVWVVLQIVNAYLQVLGVTDVSALAHLGGATVGMLFWLGWRNPKWIDFLLRASSWPRRHQ
ncbi:MAG: rhomboid family intramembrane serine protease [Thermogutta sp.]